MKKHIFRNRFMYGNHMFHRVEYKHWLLFRNRYILGPNIDYYCEIDIFLAKNIDYFCEIDIFLAKTFVIVAKSKYSWPKHCLFLRNRHILGQNIAYYCEIDIFLAKTLLILAKSRYSWSKHCLLFRNRHILVICWCRAGEFGSRGRGILGAGPGNF